MGFAENISDLALVPFQATPVLQDISLVAGTPKQLVKANPYRVTLIVGCNPAANAYLRNDSKAVQSGIVLVAGSPNWTFTQADHGLLVTLEWWVFTNQAGGALISFIEQVVTRFGQQPGQSTLIEDTDNGLFRNRSARRTNGISRTKLYSDRWNQRQTLAGIDLSGGSRLGMDFFDGSGGGQSGSGGGIGQPPADFRWPGSTG